MVDVNQHPEQIARDKRPAPKPSERAFSGQLVGQDPSDEPAADLLARIREARELLAQEVKKLPQKK